MAKGRHRASTKGYPLRVYIYSWRNHWLYFSPIRRALVKITNTIKTAIKTAIKGGNR